MLNIGLVQLEVKEGKIDYNKDNIEKIIQKRSSNDLDILCFPELCISGYDFKAADKSNNESKFFSNMAKKYKQAIIAGIKIEEKNKPYDNLSFWDEKGNLLGSYNKLHLWGKENDYFSRGDETILVDYKNWKIGLLICADLGFPEVSRKLTLEGADILIYPSAWEINNEYLFDICGAARAAENQVYVLLLNRASSEDKYCGYTSVYFPNGKMLKQVGRIEEDYMEVQLKKEEINKAREFIPWLKMRNPKAY